MNGCVSNGHSNGTPFDKRQWQSLRNARACVHAHCSDAAAQDKPRFMQGGCVMRSDPATRGEGGVTQGGVTRLSKDGSLVAGN